jgi:antitoxin Phd
MEWKLADAKNRLSELVTKATTEGPQTIRRHGDSVVVIKEEEYLALKGEQLTFEQYLLAGPRFDELKLKPRGSRKRVPKL